MPSTILSALEGERVLHANALATVTGKLLVVRREDQSQSILSVASITKVQVCKTGSLKTMTCAAGCLLAAAAAANSKESSGTVAPFAVAGVALVTGAKMMRRAAVAFVIEGEVLRTAYGTLHEAATLAAAVRFAQSGKELQGRSFLQRYSWVPIFLELLV